MIKTNKASDRQVGGEHYKSLGIQPWDAMCGWDREHFKGFLRFCAVKRLARWDSKDSALQDVQKSIHELQRLEEMLIEDLEPEEEEVRTDAWKACYTCRHGTLLEENVNFIKCDLDTRVRQKSLGCYKWEE